MIEQNPELKLAEQFIETTGTNLFLTGKAGTGKTTFLRRLRERSPKRMIVLAPTGIAAINAGGVTIHSFFQLPFAPYVPDSSFRAEGKAAYRYRFGKEKIRIMRSIDLLVIDEVSMVRADLLDAMDDVLRRYRHRDLPFGGVQLLMIGDLQQLAPVIKDEEWALLKDYYATPYFFSSRALNQVPYCTIELTKVYRQGDAHFLGLLNAVRENRCTPEVMRELNSRFIPNFYPRHEEGYIRLTTHNYQAQQINDLELNKLTGRSYSFQAEVTGTFPQMSFPTDAMLILKVGAQVMFVKNDTTGGHRYYNGMLGEVTGFVTEGIEVRCRGEQRPILVQPEEWTNARYVLDEETKEITEAIDGTFRQYPLKLAWAITIHKSQGLTFDRAVIDASGSFAHGQTYVALSRCRTLEGLVLSAPIGAQDVISDEAVDEFSARARATQPDARQFTALQRNYYGQLLLDLFGFIRLEGIMGRMVRILDEHLYRVFPQLLETGKRLQSELHEQVTVVGQKFEVQYGRLVEASADYTHDELLQQRIHAAAAYFAPKLRALLPFATARMEIDNKVVRKQMDEVQGEFIRVLRLKIDLLDYVERNGFYTTPYLRQKAVLTLSDEDGTSGNKGRKRAVLSSSSSSSSSFKKSGKPGKVEVPQDVLHPKLYDSLVKWRRAVAEENGTPAYTIVQQKALIGIANLKPRTTDALLMIPYMGKKTVEKYGKDILMIVGGVKD